MRNKNILITGLQSWDIEIGSNCKNIAVEFSKNNSVLYVNPPLDRLSVLRGNKNSNYTTTKQGLNLKEVKKNLWVYYPPSQIESISRLPITILFDFLNKRNNKIFANDIQKALNKLNFKDFIHFCDSDMFRSFYLKELLKPSCYIYYTRDNLLAVKYWQIQGNRIEPQHFAKADIVMANSVYLSQIASKSNKNSFFIGQGCDLSAFNPTNIDVIPEDIGKIPQPIIGYIGTLKTLRLDIEIIKFIANKKPAWNIVLVGPEDDNFKTSDLHTMQNVYFLGSKEEKELPAYLNSFDVAINPQVVNEVTIGNYPRKIDEYLAMGKPVVASKTIAMDYFENHISLASNKEDWVKLIEDELENDKQELKTKRSNFAKEHTWQNNVEQIYKHIQLFHDN